MATRGNCVTLLMLFATLGCGQTIRWVQNAPGCGSDLPQGHKRESIAIDGLTLWSWISENQGKLVVSIAAVNQSLQIVTISPKTIMLEITDPASKPIHAIAMKKLLAKPSALAGIASVAASAAEGYEAVAASGRQRQVGTATIHNPDGTTSQAEIYTRDDSAAQTQARNAEARRQAQESRAAGDGAYNAAIWTTTLEETVLLPGQKVSGFVYFPKKGYKSLVVSVPVNQRVFEFPFAN